uniref:Uncharacterized protein n=1 Tax=Avena sativa TaxID=4498 RepID=A0ACD6ANX3_AVESA
MRSAEAYKEVKAYLADTTARGARHLRAEGAKDADRLELSMVDGEEVADVLLPEEGGGTVFWWAYSKAPQQQDWRWGGGGEQENRRYYRLFFLDAHRDAVLNAYLPRVRREGRDVMVKNRRRNLSTNISVHQSWTHVPFEHPKTFATLAMDPTKKKEIVDDLDAFRNGKDYYAQIDKAWKRGYLLHGPPGTGSRPWSPPWPTTSTTTSSTSSSPPCTPTPTSASSSSRPPASPSSSSRTSTAPSTSPAPAPRRRNQRTTTTKPPRMARRTPGARSRSLACSTSSTGCGRRAAAERIIVFTTNHLEKLDPTLIRRGRMDKHIEMGYCCAPAFEFLARTYLGVEEHELFATVGSLLQEVDMTPADVAKNLTPKSAADDADSCLRGLVAALEKTKEDKANGRGMGQHPEEDDGGAVAGQE